MLKQIWIYIQQLKMIGLSKNGEILTMHDYDAIFKNNITENTTKNNLRY